MTDVFRRPDTAKRNRDSSAENGTVADQERSGTRLLQEYRQEIMAALTCVVAAKVVENG